MEETSDDGFDVPGSVRTSRLEPLVGAVPYLRRSRSRCFICAIVERDPDYPHHIVHEDKASIAFLVKRPTLWAHTLVAPKRHREQVTGDFDPDEYLDLQRVVHATAEAIRKTVPCERLYVMSLGSQQLNRHVHWHVAPLPPGVWWPRQQLRAFSELLTGVLVGPDDEFAQLAQRIGAKVNLPDDDP